MKKATSFLLGLIGAAWLALSPLPALAYGGTILFAATEDVDWLSCTGTCVVDTNGARFRGTWSRGGMSLGGANGTSDPPPNYLLSQVFANQTTIWVHFESGNVTGGVVTTLNQQMICIMGSDGTPAVCIRGTGSNGQIKVSTRNNAGTFSDLVTCTANTFPSGGLDRIDWKLTYAVAGESTMYLNGSSSNFCTFTGDTTTNSRTAVNQVRFAGGIATTANQVWSEVIVGTDDTRSLGFLSMFTNANGTSTAWTGTNVCTAIWNAQGSSDASFASVSTNNLIHQCGVNSTQPSGTYNVIATLQAARVLRGATGPQHFEFNTRTGGSDFNSTDFNPTTGFANYNYIQATNPATTNPWAQSDLTAAGYNIGLKDTP